jgi:hypothetical protein
MWLAAIGRGLRPQITGGILFGSEAWVRPLPAILMDNLIVLNALANHQIAEGVWPIVVKIVEKCLPGRKADVRPGHQRIARVPKVKGGGTLQRVQVLFLLRMVVSGLRVAARRKLKKPYANFSGATDVTERTSANLMLRTCIPGLSDHLTLMDRTLGTH